MVYGDVAVARHTLRGAVISSIFVKKDGRWQFLQAQGTRIAPERKPINVPSQVLDSFVGRYQFGPNAIAAVTREGDNLRWRGGNRMPVKLVPYPRHISSRKRQRRK